MSKRGCRSSFAFVGVFLLAAALAILLSSAAVSAQSSKIMYTDPSPPSGWYQCAGFTNTAGDDVDSGFADGCLNSASLRIRVWNSAGTLEEDIYSTGLSKFTAWPNWNYLGGFSDIVKSQSTYWSGTTTFFTATDGRDACGQKAAANGLTFGTGNANSALIAAGAAGYDEYRVSCGGQSLPDRKIAMYTNTPPPDPCASADLSKNKDCCAKKGFKWLKSGELSAGEAVAEPCAEIPAVAKGQTAYNGKLYDLCSVIGCSDSIISNVAVKAYSGKLYASWIKSVYISSWSTPDGDSGDIIDYYFSTATVDAGTLTSESAKETKLLPASMPGFKTTSILDAVPGPDGVEYVYTTSTDGWGALQDQVYSTRLGAILTGYPISYTGALDNILLPKVSGMKQILGLKGVRAGNDVYYVWTEVAYDVNTNKYVNNVKAAKSASQVYTIATMPAFTYKGSNLGAGGYMLAGGDVKDLQVAAATGGKLAISAQVTTGTGPTYTKMQWSFDTTTLKGTKCASITQGTALTPITVPKKAAVTAATAASPAQAGCGNGLCEPAEARTVKQSYEYFDVGDYGGYTIVDTTVKPSSCPQDCNARKLPSGAQLPEGKVLEGSSGGWPCGNGVCDPAEVGNCIDCISIYLCGNSKCEGNEKETCQKDCWPDLCGNSICEQVEAQTMADIEVINSGALGDIYTPTLAAARMQECAMKDCQSTLSYGDYQNGYITYAYKVNLDPAHAKCGNSICEPGEKASCAQDCTAPSTTAAATAAQDSSTTSLAVAYTTAVYKPSPVYYIKSGYVSYIYLARSTDGGATWPSNSQWASTEPKEYEHRFYTSASGSGANDVDFAYVQIQGAGSGDQKALKFYGVDRSVGADIDSGSASTSTFLKSPSLKALDRDNLVVSYIQTKPSYGTCGATSNSLKFASSADGGKTWASTIVDYLHSDYSSIDAIGQTVFVSYNAYSGTYATCGQGGQAAFAKSTDGGKTWTKLAIESGAGGTSIAAADAKNVFVAYAADGGLVKVATSADGGATWKKVKVDSGRMPSIKAVSSSTLVVAYIGSDDKLKFAKSTDGGATWVTSIVEPSATASNAAIGVAGSSSVYIAYTTSANNNVVVAMSTDGGTTWSKRTIENANSVRDLSLYVAAKAGKTDADSQFKDSKGDRKAAEGVRLFPDQESCSNDAWVARTRECKGTACTSSQSDAALCDKASDCVFNGKCYSDIKTVAATFFSNDQKAVWSSPAWKPEVAADINGDGRLEVCDPGQWQNPTGTVAGTVTDFTTSAPVSGATVNMVGTPPNQGTTFTATTAADGTYTINNVDAFTYDMTASKSGYNDAVKANEPIQPFQTNIVDFQLTPADSGGVWGGGTAAVSGTVKNITGQPVQGAVVKVLGTSATATTAADGTYSIAGIPSGTYDVSASKPSDGYSDATALGVDLSLGTVTIDFTLLLSLGSCTNDCTKVGSSSCDASCDGKGSCKFYSEETKQACDGTFGIIDLPGGRQVNCCKGQPYTPQKADVTVQAKQIVKSIKPVLYQGKLVNLVTLLFIPDKSN